MRMLLTAKFCRKTFNDAIKDGSASQKMKRILDELKPEAVYFTAVDGTRTALVILDLPDPSKIPTIAEPFMLLFNSQIDLKPVMTPDDLMKANLDVVGKKWT